MILIEDDFGIYCPVKVLCKFLVVRPLAPEPLFTDFLSRPIKCVRVVSMIKRCNSLCGLDPSEFNTHSFAPQIWPCLAPRTKQEINSGDREVENECFPPVYPFREIRSPLELFLGRRFLQKSSASVSRAPNLF